MSRYAQNSNTQLELEMLTFEERVLCGNMLQQASSGSDPDPELNSEIGPTANTCSRWYALAVGNEIHSADPSLSYRCLPYHLSCPSLDFCCLCLLYYYHLYHLSLQRAVLLERAHSLSWLQCPFRRVWWWTHQAWRSSWHFCPSWAPGRLSTHRSLGSREGGRSCVPAHSSWGLYMQTRRCREHQCQRLMLQSVVRRDCHPWFPDGSAMRSCRHLRSSVAWCSKGLP